MFVASCSANYYYNNDAPAPVNGVPQDTVEVQHAKAIHLAAVAKAQSGAHSSYPSYDAYAAPQQYNHAPAYYNSEPSYYNSGPSYYKHAPAHFEPAPAPVNGVPQDTVEVKHAKAAHFALYSQAQAQTGSGYNSYPAQYAPSAYHHGYEHSNGHEDDGSYKPQYDGASNSGYGHGHEDDGSYKPQNYDGHYH